MIGVCIKYFHENYGGMLQAFATTQILEKMGLEYELIRYEKKKNPVFVLKSLPRLFNGILLNDKYEMIKKKIGRLRHADFAHHDRERMKAFWQFRDTHFTRLSPVCKGYQALEQRAESYEAVVTGSDQLWSPAGLPTNYYNLQFVPDHVKKISYASSFGVSQIPWYQKKRTAAFLNRLDAISMRENRGSEIVKELTGKEVPVVLDPVFMLTQEEWAFRIPVRKPAGKPYIFAYFLGASPRHRKAVQMLAERTGLRVIALRHLDQYVEADEQFGDFAPYQVGPAEFLNLIRHAEYICTDSFHGACFSILHHKKFTIFSRYSDTAKHSKNSRIETLCKNLGLENRRYTEEAALSMEPAIDYDAVEKKLEKLRGEAWQYLHQALR